MFATSLCERVGQRWERHGVRASRHGESGETQVRTARAVGAIVIAALCVGPLLAACDVDGRTAGAGRDDRRPRASSTPDTHATGSPSNPTQSRPGGPHPTGHPKGPSSRGWHVSRVIDGDTVEVSRGRRTLDVRLIGIDTPETVHPTEPIECYGPEASAFAERTLQGEPVTLEFDRTQGRPDYYGRTLAYVWRTRPSPQLFNLAAVRRGYALEYTYDTAYAWQQPFKRAERLARGDRLGVWRCPHPGS